MTTVSLGGTAVVIGGSIAGSCAATVLRPHFGRVLVFDRDELPDDAVPRHGAMQGVHFHALLARGRQVVESLHPGFLDDVIAAGAALTSHADSWVHQPYGWGPRAEGPTKNVGASRLLIELVLRRRVRELAGVEGRARHEVTGLVHEAGRVRGVKVRHGDAAPREVRADLVVDATGRGSALDAWLAALGTEVPEPTTVNAYWGYASRFLELPEGAAPPVVGGFPVGRAAAGPSSTRGGFLLRQEDDRWLVTLSGCAKDFPPGDEDGFLAFAASLPFPHIAEALRVATPTSDIRTWRNTVNRRRALDRATNWPAGLVPLGDAVCSFNPVYGQGMSVAALESLDLQAELEGAATDRGGDLHGIEGRVLARVARTLDQPWRSASRADYGVPGVTGTPAPAGLDDELAYVDRVVALGRDDLEVYQRISATNQLVIDDSWMHEPAVRDRVLASWDELGAVMGRAGEPRPVR